MSLVTLPKTRPSAIEAALYEQYPDWFHTHYKQLDQFLERTVTLPATVLVLPLPTPPQPQPAAPVTSLIRPLPANPASVPVQFQADTGTGTATSAKYTRSELVSMLWAGCTAHLAKVLAQREHLVSTGQVPRETGWRWRKEQQGLAAKLKLATKPQPQHEHVYKREQLSQSSNRSQLIQVTAHASTVYECLARGVVLNKVIADALGLSSLSARVYKLGLYNTLLFTVLQGAGW